MLIAIDIYNEINTLSKKDGREGFFSKTDFNTWSPSVEQLLMNYYCDQSKQNDEVIESLRPFLKEVSFPITNGILTIPTDYRRFEDLSFTKVINSETCGENPITTTLSADYIDIDEFNDMMRSPIRKPDFSKGKVRYRIINQNIQISEKVGTANLIYVRNPVYANLNFTFNSSTEEEEYNATSTLNFEFLPKDRNKIVDLFCMKLGMSIRDRDLMSWMQVNSQLEQMGK